jgi:hypothetical protein
MGVRTITPVVRGVFLLGTVLWLTGCGGRLDKQAGGKRGGLAVPVTVATAAEKKMCRSSCARLERSFHRLPWP